MSRISPGIYKDDFGNWYGVIVVCPLRGTKKRIVVFFDYDMGAECCVAEPLSKFLKRRFQRVKEEEYPPNHWTIGIPAANV